MQDSVLQTDEQRNVREAVTDAKMLSGWHVLISEEFKEAPSYHLIRPITLQGAVGLISEMRFGGIGVTLRGSAVTTVFVLSKHTGQREGKAESRFFPVFLPLIL